MSYPHLLSGLAVDGAVIALLTYVYYRRHKRPDLIVAFVALNLGVFAAVSLLASQRGGLALGFGLFGILSIVRLRSTALSQGEVGYYFIALTLGLVNGLGQAHLSVMLTLDVVLLVVMYAVDRPRIGRDISRRTVTLDVVHADEASLRADLAGRLGADILSCQVIAVDYVRDTTVCEVQCRARPRPADVAGARG